MPRDADALRNPQDGAGGPQSHSSTRLPVVLDGLLPKHHEALYRHPSCVVSEEARHIWEERMAGLPKWYPTGACWSNKPPLSIYQSIQKTMSKYEDPRDGRPFTIYDKDGPVRNGNLMSVMAHYMYPDPEDPLFITHVPLSDIGKIRVPAVYQPVRSYHAINPPFANITAEYTFIDVHVDHGADVLFIALAGCRNLVFMWPPTQNNLEEYRLCRHTKHGRFMRMQSRLEGSLVAELDSRAALHIPCGVLYAVYTVQGGICIGQLFHCIDDILSIASICQLDLEDEALAGEERSRAWTVYTDVVTLALRQGRPSLLRQCMDSFLTLRKAYLSVRQYESDEARNKRLQQIIRAIEALSTASLIDYSVCSCGKTTSIVAEGRRNHLKYHFIDVFNDTCKR